MGVHSKSVIVAELRERCIFNVYDGQQFQLFPIVVAYKSSSLLQHVELERNQWIDDLIQKDPFVMQQLFWYGIGIPFEKVIHHDFKQKSQELFRLINYLGFKVLLLGQTGAGKTRLTRALQKEEFIPDRDLRTKVFDCVVLNLGERGMTNNLHLLCLLIKIYNVLICHLKSF